MPVPNSTHPNSSLPSGSPFSYERLIACEEEQLRLAGSEGGRRQLDCEVSHPGPADEPWLVYTNRDRVGLALSGGGIRSATFNLGLMQAMQEKGVLGLFDYVATVSGGGYVGGFWTSWRLRSREKALGADGAGAPAPLLFPRPTEEDLSTGGTFQSDGRRLPPLRDNRERPEVRHLREFSRFIMPRLGVFEVEMWNGVVAVLGGLIPSIVFVSLLTAVALLVWSAIGVGLLDSGWPWAALGMMGITAALHGLAERQWRAVNPAENRELQDRSIRILAVVATLVSGAAVVAVRRIWNSAPDVAPLAPLGWAFGGNAATLSTLYAPALAWTAAGGILLIARFVQFALDRGEGGSTLFVARSLDRTIARCLAPAAVWVFVGLVWQAAFHWTRRGDTAGLTGGAMTGGAAVGLGTVFALLRRWLETSVKSGGKSGLLDRLKPQLPKLIANATVLLFIAFIAELVIAAAVDSPGRWVGITGTCLLLWLIILWLLDPSRVGLHDFYRGRIARCFLGAANPGALKPRPDGDYNRYTHEREEDDFVMGDLQRRTREAETGTEPVSPLPLRPIHLVCCAANNLDGDHLASLYRGARSAVLSQRGLSLGNQTLQLPTLSFSAALTASASAFNSQMGAISMSLGPAVTFLMVALNLRLGLWLPHPAGGKSLQPRFPGRLFLRELLGWTQSATPSHPAAAQPDYVHLSDGAHFENFGFYELIRRHCRYVILSDCGADPDTTFDDFATSLRRIREDFGVEVEIDFTPLRPGPDGLSPQHVAVGTIHYDGLAGSDKGTLLYFKPALTGDEPCDVAQYRHMNPDFPQQTTADQFYDEAQWESYRRLGEHAGLVIFRFLDQLESEHRTSAERVFFRAARQWMPGSRDSSAELGALADRASGLEASIRDHAPESLRVEFFPETGGVATGAADRDEETRVLFYLMQGVQVMEDAWNLCHLGTEAQHPVNEGWMAYINRWAAMPSFRRWWPLLSAMYSENFRTFLNRRFQLAVTGHPDRVETAPPPRVTLHAVAALDDSGLAFREWRRRGRKFSHETDPGAAGIRREFFELRFEMAQPEGFPRRDPLQIGLVTVEILEEGDALIAQLATRDFFIPGAYAGCGFIDAMLDQLIAHFVGKTPVVEMRVRLESMQGQKDPNARQSRVHLIGFFKSRYFVYRRRPDSPAGAEIEELARDVTPGTAEMPPAAAPVKVA